MSSSKIPWFIYLLIFLVGISSCNLCAASRIGIDIATGIHQNRWGIYRNIDCEAHGPKSGSLLVEKLHKAGYATAPIGKWHIGSRDKSMIPEFMEKHGIPDSAGIYPPLSNHPEVRKDLIENGHMGSCIPEHHALYNIAEDPGEKNDLIDVEPEKANELQSIWIQEAESFPPPVRIGKEKWEQIIPKNNPFIE